MSDKEAKLDWLRNIEYDVDLDAESVKPELEASISTAEDFDDVYDLADICFERAEKLKALAEAYEVYGDYAQAKYHRISREMSRKD